MQIEEKEIRNPIGNPRYGTRGTEQIRNANCHANVSVNGLATTEARKR